MPSRELDFEVSIIRDRQPQIVLISRRDCFKYIISRIVLNANKVKDNAWYSTMHFQMIFRYARTAALPTKFITKK
jgi:hypothetical protein